MKSRKNMTQDGGRSFTAAIEGGNLRDFTMSVGSSGLTLRGGQSFYGCPMSTIEIKVQPDGRTINYGLTEMQIPKSLSTMPGIIELEPEDARDVASHIRNCMKSPDNSRQAVSGILDVLRPYVESKRERAKSELERLKAIDAEASGEEKTTTIWSAFTVKPEGSKEDSSKEAEEKIIRAARLTKFFSRRFTILQRLKEDLEQAEIREK